MPIIIIVMNIVHNTTQHNNVLKYVIIMLNYNSCFVSLYTAFSMQFMADTLYLVLCVVYVRTWDQLFRYNSTQLLL